MTLKNVLDLINKYDKVSIHNSVGYVVFDGMATGLSTPVMKKIISEYLDNTVDQIRPYNDTLVILLK